MNKSRIAAVEKVIIEYPELVDLFLPMTFQHTPAFQASAAVIARGGTVEEAQAAVQQRQEGGR